MCLNFPNLHIFKKYYSLKLAATLLSISGREALGKCAPCLTCGMDNNSLQFSVSPTTIKDMII